MVSIVVAMGARDDPRGIGGNRRQLQLRCTTEWNG
jgi:hypothetical protein